ncbi:alpha/beta fold hydrolase [Glutamicibacter creatinolyticus]|uniref:alpha/beta fold hydrolase n=1 Tax=Glutamicibacter creatinolyticus TaxID=162496 RepID=UPI0037C18B46
MLADATGEPQWPARRGYVLTTQDTAVPAGMQSRVAKRFDATIYQLETGHLPMLTKARELARIIERFNS